MSATLQIWKRIKGALLVLLIVLAAQSKTAMGTTADCAFAKFTMVVPMLSLIAQEQKVFSSVVESVSVNMVNNLLGLEQPSKLLLQNPAMLQNVITCTSRRLIGPQNLNISVSGNSSATAKRWIQLGGFSDPIPPAFETSSLPVSRFGLGWIISDWNTTIRAMSVFMCSTHTCKVLLDSNPQST